jgi:hypothetical protein
MRLPLLFVGLALVAAPLSAQTPKPKPTPKSTTVRPAARTTVQAPLSAEKDLWYGPQASFADESDLGLGARAFYTLDTRRPLAVITTFDYFFPSAPTGVDAKHWEVNGNMAYQFVRGRWKPYVGPGLNLARRTADVPLADVSASETSLGVNMLGGVRRTDGRKRQYFAEARYEVGGGEQFLVTAGVLF